MQCKIRTRETDAAIPPENILLRITFSPCLFVHFSTSPIAASLAIVIDDTMRETNSKGWALVVEILYAVRAHSTPSCIGLHSNNSVSSNNVCLLMPITSASRLAFLAIKSASGTCVNLWSVTKMESGNRLNSSLPRKTDSLLFGRS
jgi:hypothetical protein